MHQVLSATKKHNNRLKFYFFVRCSKKAVDSIFRSRYCALHQMQKRIKKPNLKTALGNMTCKTK